MDFLCFSLMRVKGDDILEHHHIGINHTAKKMLSEIFGYHLGNEAKFEQFIERIKKEKTWTPPEIGTVDYSKNLPILAYFDPETGEAPSFDKVWLNLSNEGSQSLKRYLELTHSWWAHCIIYKYDTKKWQMLRAKDGLVYKRTPLNTPLVVHRLMSA